MWMIAFHIMATPLYLMIGAVGMAIGLNFLVEGLGGMAWKMTRKFM